jgi:hypothetical protein
MVRLIDFPRKYRENANMMNKECFLAFSQLPDLRSLQPDGRWQRVREGAKTIEKPAIPITVRPLL